MNTQQALALHLATMPDKMSLARQFAPDAAGVTLAMNGAMTRQFEAVVPQVMNNAVTSQFAAVNMPSQAAPQVQTAFQNIIAALLRAFHLNA